MELLLRIEDLDGPRVKPGAAEQLVNTLAWLGIDHDGAQTVQSHELDPYRNAMRALADKRLVYRCDLSRTQIEQAVTAPHAGEHEIRFPPELRPNGPGPPTGPGNGPDSAFATRWAFTEEHTNYRLCVSEETITIEDEIAGPVKMCPFHQVGDFVVWTKRGVPAYQLAVVVDDARQGVTHVIRGDDLLPSAGRQTLLYRALGWEPPTWMHLPLVLGPDGRRLAKRHGDTRVAHYQQLGVPAQRIVGLLAYWSGAAPARTEMSAVDFLARFSIDTLPRCPITFTQDDNAWLLSRS
jgi:glutamyl-tRNA synthetase